MKVRELIDHLKKLNPNKSISAFAPDGNDEIEFEIEGFDENEVCAWIELKVY